MLDIICTRKEKTQVFLFFEIYKMVLIIFKSENSRYTGAPPFFLFVKKVNYLSKFWFCKVKICQNFGFNVNISQKFGLKVKNCQNFGFLR